MINNQTEHLTISREVIIILKWLITNEESKIQKILTNALKKGLYSQLHTPAETFSHELAAQELEDFFVFLENSLSTAITQKIAEDTHHHHMIPALDKIDSSLCDTQTIRIGLEKASQKIAKNPQQSNPTEILFQEILKQWKPRIKTNH